MNLIYEGRDITQSVQILQCVHRDASIGRSDSLDIILNHAAEWYRWEPKAGDTIEISHKGYTTGALYVNTVRPEGKEYRILATSLPPNAWQNAWRSYSHTTLEEIVTQCATECGMTGEVYGARFSTPYAHLQRENTGAAAFLQRLCFLEGAALKAYNGKMQAIFIPYAQDQRTVRSLRLTGEETGLTYTHTPEAKRGFVRVVTPDFEVTVTDSGAPGCKGKVISAPAMDTITASRWARGVLLMCNRKAETLEVSIGFDPAMTALARVEVVGNSAFAGGWLVDEAEHDLYNEMTRVKLVRCVTTVSESASITMTEATGSTTRRIAPEVEAELERIEGLIPTEPATATTDGLMSAEDKAKLDGIEAEANKYTHPTYTARTGQPTANKTPGFGETFTISQIKSDATGHVTAATDRTVKIPDTEATASAAGLMSAADKTKLTSAALVFEGTCGTAGDTSAKAVTCPSFEAASLVTGAKIFVTFSANNSAAVADLTLNVNETGAKPLRCFRNGGVNTIPGTGYIDANQTYLFCYDGTNWVTTLDYNSNTTYSDATQSSHGLMSTADKVKLDGIEEGANAYTHPSYTARTGKPTGNQTPGFGSTFTVSQITSDATGHVTAATDRTVKIPDTEATASAAGLMSAADKSKLEGIAEGATANAGTVTKVSTGAGLTGGDITGTGTVKADLTSETKLTNAAADGTETSGRVYPVRLDKNGKLAVNVPWTNVNSDYLTAVTASNHYTPTAASGSELTAAIEGTAGAYAKNTTYTVLTGVKAQRDAKGHVTGLTYTAQQVKDTNDNTKVTSAANHYAPAEDDDAELTAAIEGTAGAYAKDTEYTVLTGVKAQRDAKGHVTGLTYTAQKVKDTNTTYSAATQSANGLMSKDDKKKLDGIAEEANKYVLPAADSDTLGGVRVTTTDRTTTPEQLLTRSEQGYSSMVGKLTDGDFLYVDNPIWGVTTESNAVAALMNSEQKRKLDSIAEGATANAGTVTEVSTGAGLTGGDITGSGTVKADLTSETKLTNAAADGTETSGRVYPVRLDKNGKLAVNVPWTNVNSSYLTAVTASNHYTPTAASGSELTAAIEGTAGAYAKNTTYTVLTGVKAQRDAKGHVTGLTYTAQQVKDTNDNTKVTSAANHYAPAEDDDAELTAAIDGTAGTYAKDTEYTVLTGVKAQRDAKGHVTGLTYTAQKVKDTNTTYESKAAASGGTAVSLVTTGEKYTWNQKTSNTGTVTKVSTGAGLTGGDITGSGTVKADLTSETKLTNAAADGTETSGRVYPVRLDKNGKLAVNVPWTNVNSDYLTAVTASNHYTPTAASGSELTAAIDGSAGTYAKDTEYTVLTGVKAQRDAKGHVTGLTYTAQKVKDTNTTYESKAAASGGTAVSLVTTGEKYTWNQKTSNTGTVTKVSTGAGLTGGDITGSGTVKADLTSETKLTNAAADGTETSGRVYPVRLDKNGKLAVNVPWTNVNSSYLTAVTASNHYTPTAASGSELTAAIDGDAGAYAKDTEYTVLTGIKAQRDAKGHVTGLTYTAQKIKDTNSTYTTGNNMIGANGSNYIAHSTVYRYQLLFQVDENKFTPLNNVSNGASNTSKTILTSVEFDPFGQIFGYNSTTTVSKNAAIRGDYLYYTHTSFNTAYSLNVSADVNPMTAAHDVYLKVSPQSSGKVKLASATPIVQTLPTSNDGYWYIYLGRAVSATNLSLHRDHPVYYHNGSQLCQKFPPEQEASVIALGGTALAVSCGTISNLPTTINNAAIKSSMVALNAVFSNPHAQIGNWTITTANGSVTISGKIRLTTDLTLYLG